MPPRFHATLSQLLGPDPEPGHGRAWAGRGRGAGVEGWADACRPSFRRARAGAPAQAQESPARGKNARGAKGRRAPAARGRSPRGRRVSAEEARQRRMDLLGLSCLALAVYLGYVIYLGWNGGRVGNGTETALAHAVGGGAIVFPGRARPRRPGADPAAADALAAGAGGRGVRDLRRAAAGARGPDRGPGSRRASARSCSIPPSSASTGAPWARSSTGRARRCSSGSAPTSSPCCWSSPACCW